jgi:ATP-dependent Lon protease
MIVTQNMSAYTAATLRAMHIGQHHVINAIADYLQVNNKEKPLFLIYGHPGTGKTTIASLDASLYAQCVVELPICNTNTIIKTLHYVKYICNVHSYLRTAIIINELSPELSKEQGIIYSLNQLYELHNTRIICTTVSLKNMGIDWLKRSVITHTTPFSPQEYNSIIHQRIIPQIAAMRNIQNTPIALNKDAEQLLYGTYANNSLRPMAKTLDNAVIDVLRKFKPEDIDSGSPIHLSAELIRKHLTTP